MKNPPENQRVIHYNEEEWIVINEFLSGNGTYDILMLEIQNVKNEKIIIAEMDII